MASKLAQLQQLRALAVRTQTAIAAVAKAASDAITQVANEKADKDHTHTLPTASSTVLGGVKLGDGIESEGDAISPAFRSRGKPDDMNNAMPQGWYAYTNGTANVPVSGSGVVQVLSVNGYIWPIQILFSKDANSIFLRNYDGTNWSAWVNVSNWSRLPYTITFESCYAGTDAGGSAAEPIVFSLSQRYDAVGIIPWSSFGDEACVVRNLFELVTNESHATSFSGNFIPTGMLSHDWTTLASLPTGCGAIAGMRPGEGDSDLLHIRRNGTNLELFGDPKADGSNAAASALNRSGTVYYYYGLNFVPFHF